MPGCAGFAIGRGFGFPEEQSPAEGGDGDLSKPFEPVDPIQKCRWGQLGELFSELGKGNAGIFGGG